MSATDLVFLGDGAGGQTGIYDAAGGQLRKVSSVGDAIRGKTIAGLGFSRGGPFGDPIAFQATFSDGVEGVYAIDVVPPPGELRVTAVERSGTDLLHWRGHRRLYNRSPLSGLNRGDWKRKPEA